MREVRVRVRVRPGARRESFEETAPGTFAASVRERPQGNAANVRLIFLLARHFRVPEKAVRIISGHRGTSKVIKVVQ